MRPGSNKAPMLKPVAELHHTATCHGVLVSPLCIITSVAACDSMLTSVAACDSMHLISSAVFLGR